jgi:hypothetical protein
MFQSSYCYRGHVEFPEFSGTRVMMMPIIIGSFNEIPDEIEQYEDMLAEMFSMAGHIGKVGYITLDERKLLAGETTRRSGLHVDGVYQGNMGAWGGGGGWGSVGNGMLTASSYPGCRAWNQSFSATPGPEGECDHLAAECRDSAARVFAAGDVYWLDGLCVHESLPMTEAVSRQFLRLSLPSNGPWFEGYTENPHGVMPTGPILPRRYFMDE